MSIEFSLFTKRKDKVIQIVMKEDGKREVLAMVPYRGGRYSFEYSVQRELAAFIGDSIRNEKIASRLRIAEMAKRVAIDQPFFNVLEK